MAEELVEGISLMGELSGVDSNDVLDVLGAEIGMKFPVFFGAYRDIEGGVFIDTNFYSLT
jgi:hypothetical protein